MSFTVHQIVGSNQQLVKVRPTDSAESALAQMIEHDFSQLPVVDFDDKPLGVITGDSILRALKHFAIKLDVLNVADAMVKAITHYEDDDLFEMLDDLRDAYVVLIVDGEDRLSGVVTSYDATEYFRRRAEDMMLVEDIEGALKAHIEESFRDAQTNQIDQQMLEATVLDITDKRRDQRKRFGGAVRKYLSLQGATGTEPNETALDTAFAILDDKTPPKTFKDLTLSEYTQLLLHKSRASYYRSVFNFDADAIRHLMDEVRNTRNDLAHFRQEITTSQRKQLHFCSEWLDRHPVPEPTISGTEPKTDQETPSAESTLELPETQALPEQQEIIPVEEALGPKDSRYAPLALWLQGQPVDQDRVMLTLEQIEGIINSPLPPSARQHRSWWANDPVSHVQSQQWLEVGWRVSYINITEGRITFARIIEREKAYIDFFGALIAKLQEVATFPVWSPAPNGSNWNSVTGLPEVQPQLTFVYSFARSHRFRIEIYIDTGDSVRNKQIFDRLHAQKTEIEATIGEELSWERLDNRRASRIALYRDGAITDDADKLASLRKWAVDAMIRFYDTLAKPTSDILKAVL